MLHTLLMKIFFIYIIGTTFKIFYYLLLDHSVSPPYPEYPGKKSESPAVAGPLCLEELAARAVIATRRNFYSVRSLAPRIKDYLTQIAQQIEVIYLNFSFKKFVGSSVAEPKPEPEP